MEVHDAVAVAVGVEPPCFAPSRAALRTGIIISHDESDVRHVELPVGDAVLAVLAARYVPSQRRAICQYDCGRIPQIGRASVPVVAIFEINLRMVQVSSLQSEVIHCVISDS